MKEQLGFLGVIIALMILGSFNTVHAIPNPNLIAAWTFDEGDGDTTADITAKGHTGTLMGEPEWVEGRNGSGLKFMTTSQYVIVADAADLHFEDKDFSFAAWINIDEFKAAESPAVLTKRNLVAGNGSPTLLYGVKDTLVLRLDMRDNVGGMNTVLGSTIIEAQKWTHVAVVKDSKNLTFFVNGVKDNSTAHGFGGSFTSEEPLYIGVHHYTGVWNCCLTGTIDELGIFNKALTAAEVKSAMESMSPVDSFGKLSTSWGNVKSEY